jgi:hypothetical protein
MKRSIDVLLGDGPHVGTLRYDLQGRRESAAFEYGAGWLGDPARFALGPALPLQVGPQFHRKSKDGKTVLSSARRVEFMARFSFVWRDFMFSLRDICHRAT